MDQIFGEKEFKIQKNIKWFERPHKRKKIGCYKTDNKCLNKYGITRKQLDVILSQLCQHYGCQWAIISTVLYRQHNILMNQSSIKDRYSIYLDPRLKKQGFTYQEQRRILKKFFVQGKKFRDIRQIFPLRDRYMIKSVLQINLRKAIKKLQKHVEKEIYQMPQDKLIGNGQINKVDLLRGIISESKVQWQYNSSTYKLIYLFMVGSQQIVRNIPNRLAEIKKEVDSQKKKKYNQIDLNLYRKEIQNQNQKRKKILIKKQIHFQGPNETCFDNLQRQIFSQNNESRIESDCLQMDQFQQIISKITQN